MKITRLNELQKKKMAMEGAKDVWKQVPISKNDGSPVFSFRVFTVEPGVYIPGLGGVRIEDDVLIKSDGVELLTKSSRNLIEI